MKDKKRKIGHKPGTTSGKNLSTLYIPKIPLYFIL
jgi:hypothetical protein